MNEYIGWFSFGLLILGILRFLLDYVGKERLKQLLLDIGGSKHLKTFQYTLLIVFVPLILLLAVIIYTILIARGELYRAIAAFMLIAISGLLFAFMNYKLFQKQIA